MSALHPTAAIDHPDFHVPAASPTWPWSARRQPSRSSVGAVFGSGIKCDDGGRSGFMDRVNNRFKDLKALRRQGDTCADYNAGIVCPSQVTFYYLPSRPILPSSVRHLLYYKRHTGACLLNAPAVKQDLRNPQLLDRSRPTKLWSSPLPFRRAELSTLMIRFTA